MLVDMIDDRGELGDAAAQGLGCTAVGWNVVDARCLEHVWRGRVPAKDDGNE